ncbi:MAG: hypothetical protein AVDCRST_MAG85-3206 [uncultured Solirubrobacteraceae bacterium]|uniref:Knr4/Smi1-like domain-containing protein n=1 Tax=uncultured Solirubrobacteraceae bacterium TaxID=1162706 RepID=A0A6J4TK55_9ACTN|nr:MAG: hypothetical protein AVDCRST_MAG85-3206 [uncultured Solirubrobacteraceae bacterium]
MLDAVLRAWDLAGESGDWPTSAAKLDEAERALGRPLDPALRALYERSGPGEYAGSNLGVLPPLPDGEDDLSLANAGALLREWGWPAAEEATVFATNGAGSYFGVWSGGARPLVVDIGEFFDVEASLAVVGADLPRFLAGWSAYYLISDGRRHAALDALGVPNDLRVEDPDMDDCLRWASGDVADRERLLTVAEVAALADR